MVDLNYQLDEITKYTLLLPIVVNIGGILNNDIRIRIGKGVFSRLFLAVLGENHHTHMASLLNLIH